MAIRTLYEIIKDIDDEEYTEMIVRVLRLHRELYDRRVALIREECGLDKDKTKNALSD